ncbi:hypothetical protein J6590_097680 [Homalodisca vitripennis]|nr:hypothetical protein J6590_097680 [Homalodisca vitripennis]
MIHIERHKHINMAAALLPEMLIADQRVTRCEMLAGILNLVVITCEKNVTFVPEASEVKARSNCDRESCIRWNQPQPALPAGHSRKTETKFVHPLECNIKLIRIIEVKTSLGALSVLVEGKILGSRHRHANDTNLHEKIREHFRDLGHSATGHCMHVGLTAPR